MNVKHFIILSLCLFCTSFISFYGENRYTSVNSGVAWFDQNNKEVNAHGACIVKEGDLYYLFGEYKPDTTNAFMGFGCYSSPDLVNWKFENVVLRMQEDGILGPDRVGERVKVMKCPSTGEFVMYMHCDNMGYKDPHIGYATCKTIDGDYQFRGDLLYNGEYIKKWDMGTYQDTDGKGYLLLHHGIIYRLSDDYRSAETKVLDGLPDSGESPAMFKKDGTYFMLYSGLTSWERNDNFYFTAPAVEGPWARKGIFAPEGSLTWNSQCSFVFPISNGNDTLHMYMGDRWSFPKQGSAATQVWLPIFVNGGEMSLPAFYESWNFDKNGNWFPVNSDLKSIKNSITKQGNWDISDNTFRSNEKGAGVVFPFTGQQVSIRGLSNNTSGYAKIILRNSENEEIINTIVDFYCKNEISELKFMSPKMKNDSYTLSIEVMGEHPVWFKKDGTRFGSTDNYVIIEDVLYK